MKKSVMILLVLAVVMGLTSVASARNPFPAPIVPFEDPCVKCPGDG